MLAAVSIPRLGGWEEVGVVHVGDRAESSTTFSVMGLTSDSSCEPQFRYEVEETDISISIQAERKEVCGFGLTQNEIRVGEVFEVELSLPLGDRVLIDLQTGDEMRVVDPRELGVPANSG